MDYKERFRERFLGSEPDDEYTKEEIDRDLWYARANQVLAFIDQEKEESYAEGFGDGRTQERAALIEKVAQMYLEAKTKEACRVLLNLLTYLREPDASQGDKRTGV